MKLALIYNPLDHKLSKDAYSQTYFGMFQALVNRFEEIYYITTNCSAKDIEADVIIEFDLHSSFHIDIDDLKNHKAIKYTFFNDPHQEDFQGYYKDGIPVKKLGAKNRVIKALNQNMNYIICPYSDGYYQFIAPFLGGSADKMFVWFPVAPSLDHSSIIHKPIKNRFLNVLCSGHLWKGRPGFNPYILRRYIYSQPDMCYLPHSLSKDSSPSGHNFIPYLTNWAGAFALSEWYVIPKYLEIPLAGCVCFAQYKEDYTRMGFKDLKNYVMINQQNYKDRLKEFKAHPELYQDLANQGQQLILENYTAAHFADFIYNHASKNL